MKSKLAITSLTALLSLGLTSHALADTSSATTQPTNKPDAGHPFNQEKFAARKQEILSRMEQRRICVTNAQTPSDLKNCQSGDEHHPMGNRESGDN